jgi:hypothetical protein
VETESVVVVKVAVDVQELLLTVNVVLAYVDDVRVEAVKVVNVMEVSVMVVSVALVTVVKLV